MNNTRRNLLKLAVVVPLLSPFSYGPTSRKVNGLKTSLNAFSFNEPLLAGTMTLEDMLEFCADKGFAGVDITAYYFPGYPEVPADEFLYNIKMKAFRLGLDISGTGVRNDFTHPDKSKRAESIALVKSWIDAAEKLGAPVIRIFSGNQSPQGFTRQQILEWMIDDIRECIEYGRQHGVVVAIQNHNDFIATADQALEIIEAIDSEWFGLILDTGSYRSGDPYSQIERTAPYAVNWQIKEKIFIDGREVDTDIPKLVSIIASSGYKGYLPIETLGEGDPGTKISALLQKLDHALQQL